MIELYTQNRYTLRPGRVPENLVDIHALTYGKTTLLRYLRTDFSYSVKNNRIQIN